MIAKPGYISVMKTYADQQNSDDWLLLEFSALGFIGIIRNLSVPYLNNKDIERRPYLKF